MKFLTIKIYTANPHKLRVALCVLSGLFVTAASVGATSLMAVAEIDRYGSPGATAFAPIEGAIDKVWIEYGVKVKDEIGIRIHTKFTVKNALNLECVIQANVERSDGHSLFSKGNS